MAEQKIEKKKKETDGETELKTKISTLERDIKERRDEIIPYEHVLQKTKIELAKTENIKLIGKTFKFLNSYGSDEKWWLYKIVVGINSDALVADDYQKAPCGCEVKRQNYCFPSLLEWGYIEISRKEFNKGIAPILRELGLKRKRGDKNE